MSFTSPQRLWLLLAVAALLAIYLVVQRRRSRYAVRFTSLALLDKVAPDRPGWRRHLPPALYLIMLGLLVTGFARPAADVQVARERATVIVAVDVSLSMGSTDVAPDRLAAAPTAAADFVKSLPETFNVGLVAFAGQASTLVSPVTDRDAVLARISTLSSDAVTEQGTAIGAAIAASLQAVQTVDADAGTDPPPARVVLLSDGANTAGIDPGQAATEAAAAGLPVDSILFGTSDGQLSLDGRVIDVPVDGATLQAVAETTGGTYHEASTAAELDDVYSDIGSSVGFVTENQDISARFIGFALLLAFAAAALSMLWFSRLP
jgi:Ca-activated chloride channel family protein